MGLPVFLAVLSAALLHAVWNSLVKSGADRYSGMVLLSLFQGIIAAVLVPFVVAPLPAAWPWLAASVVVHIGYKVLLTRAYGLGDLSLVYPIARGAAPLLVGLVAMVVLGEALSPLRLTAVLMIGGGIVAMAFSSGLRLRRDDLPAVGMALLVALSIAAYTVVDAQGARASGSVAGFTLWLFLLDGVGLVLLALVHRGGAVVMQAGRRGLAQGALTGTLVLFTYWIIIWAYTQAPVVLVSALRETSVLFALLIAAVMLKEPVGRVRWGAAIVIVSGMILTRLA